jgi:hypothetical protein
MAAPSLSLDKAGAEAFGCDTKNHVFVSLAVIAMAAAHDQQTNG